MALKIVRATEPISVQNIVVTVYAAPGLGKSSLGFTAEKPLMLDFDKGAHRAAIRKDSVQIASWADINSMTAADLADYATIVIDTAGRALDVLSQDIINQNPKSGRPDGSLTLQGFGTLKSRFSQWTSFLTSLGKDVVLICHLDEQKNGDDTYERIDAQGGSKNEIYKKSDAMGRIKIDAKGERYLDFDPREGGFGKNPAQLPKIAFPDPKKAGDTLAEVISTIKASINKLTAEQAKAVKEQEAWVDAFKEADTLDKWNSQVIPMMKDKDKPGFKVFAAAEAKKRGYIADKTSGLYKQQLQAV